jgi:hypothetical protein
MAQPRRCPQRTTDAPRFRSMVVFKAARFFLSVFCIALRACFVVPQRCRHELHSTA